MLAAPLSRLAVLMTVIALASCMKPNEVIRDNAPRPPAEAALVAELEGLCRALEDENSFAFFDKVAESYAPSKLALKSAVDQELERHVGITYSLSVESSEILDDGARGVVMAGWRTSRSAREDGTVTWRDGLTEFRFVRAGSRWLLEQQNGDVLFGP